ncbi:hypothetical protein FIA58_000815 [Flavobacterium jejuense]|uniref:DUF4149 domain-containing protein n=1 Tax=Flavobacterium jejuense TaxID=1544455 RepID=A0ABX0IQP0_9FLAO|nr:hypothetical protein [Flavobacterium jejuense]NHN24204.1 hypothetical protein [Flavobacterium jejuense]
MIYLAKYIVIFFGMFLIFSSFLFFFSPFKTKEIIGKAGSTYLINYTELGIRLLIGVAFVVSSGIALYEVPFKIAGYFLIVSALVLMCVPIKKHNAFSKKAADKLKPIYLKCCAPFSLFCGILILMAFKF